MAKGMHDDNDDSPEPGENESMMDINGHDYQSSAAAAQNIRCTVGPIGSHKRHPTPCKTKRKRLGSASLIQRTPYDILCGRGIPIQNYHGNIRLHRILDSFREDYLSTDRRDKPALIRRIVSKVKEGGARFLKRKRTFQTSTEDPWEEMGDDYAYEKVSHALRCRRYVGNAKDEKVPPPLATSMGSTTTSEGGTKGKSNIIPSSNDFPAPPTLSSPSPEFLVGKLLQRGRMQRSAVPGRGTNQVPTHSALSSIRSLFELDNQFSWTFPAKTPSISPSSGVAGASSSSPFFGQQIQALPGSQQAHRESLYGKPEDLLLTLNRGVAGMIHPSSLVDPSVSLSQQQQQHQILYTRNKEAGMSSASAVTAWPASFSCSAPPVFQQARTSSISDLSKVARKNGAHVHQQARAQQSGPTNAPQSSATLQSSGPSISADQNLISLLQQQNTHTSNSTYKIIAPPCQPTPPDSPCKSGNHISQQQQEKERPKRMAKTRSPDACWQRRRSSSPIEQEFRQCRHHSAEISFHTSGGTKARTRVADNCSSDSRGPRGTSTKQDFATIQGTADVPALPSQELLFGLLGGQALTTARPPAPAPVPEHSIMDHDVLLGRLTEEQKREQGEKRQGQRNLPTLSPTTKNTAIPSTGNSDGCKKIMRRQEEQQEMSRDQRLREATDLALQMYLSEVPSGDEYPLPHLTPDHERPYGESKLEEWQR